MASVASEAPEGQAAGHAPLRAERRNEGHHDDEPGIDHQARHLGDAADVFHPVLIREAQILVEAVPHIVAVEQEGVPVHPMQLLLHEVGDRGLSGPR